MVKRQLTSLSLAGSLLLASTVQATVVTAYHVPTNTDLAGTDPSVYATSDYGNGIWRDTFRVGSKASPLAAAGAPPVDLPATPEKIWRALHQR